MSKWLGRMKDRFTHLDKDDLGKWGLMILAGLATFGASIFDTRKKDRLYERKLGDEIQKQAKRLMEKEDRS